MTGKEFKQLYEQGILAPETEYILNNTESGEEYTGSDPYGYYGSTDRWMLCYDIRSVYRKTGIDINGNSGGCDRPCGTISSYLFLGNAIYFIV